MKVKCEYCGSMIDDRAEQCPNCGAPNVNIKRTVDKTPKTIEELKQWYADRHLPPYETTRFFIGIDYKEPKAFGIYKQGDRVVVYKNKADGTRAIRYEGDDEAYGVNELYLKLKSEILNQKALNQKRGGSGKLPTNTGSCLKWFGGIAAAIIAFFSFVCNPIPTIIAVGAPLAALIIANRILKKKGNDKNNIRGQFPLLYIIYLIIISIVLIIASPVRSRASYYSYQDDIYAEYNGSYYIYDPYLFDYTPINTYYVPDDVIYNSDAYEFSQDSDSWDNTYMFEDSDYYEYNIEPEERSSYSNDHDSGWDWDSGDSWDSGGSDWGSDW